MVAAPGAEASAVAWVPRRVFSTKLFSDRSCNLYPRMLKDDELYKVAHPGLALHSVLSVVRAGGGRHV